MTDEHEEQLTLLEDAPAVDDVTSEVGVVEPEPEPEGLVEEPAEEPGPAAVPVEEEAPRVPRPPGWYARLTRRGRIALWAGLAAWLLIGLVAFGDWGRILPGGSENAGPTGPQPDLVLVVVRPAPPTLPALALLHAGSSRDVLLLPAGTIVEVPGTGPRSLAATLDSVGPDGLATSVANVLGTRIPKTLIGGPGDIRALVDALGGVKVNVPETIDVVEGGFQRTLFHRGVTTMDGEEFLAFLTRQVPGQNELERVARQNAAWRGLVSRMASRRRASSAEEPLDGWSGEVSGVDAVRVLSSLARDKGLAISTLPVTRVGVSQADLYDVDRHTLQEVRKLLRDVVTVKSSEGRRVRLLVGADGAVGPPVARALVEAGYVIVLSGKASQPYDVTRVVIAENTEGLRERGRRIIELMGTGRMGLSRAPQTLVDVTLVVGRDWAASHGFPQTTAAPTPKRRP